jgi:GNAT superfamily N-acetyltransferase
VRALGRALRPAPSEATVAASPQGLVVEPVRTVAERDLFIEFQNRLYAGEGNFVPPIIAERRDFLDARKNPFLQKAELELFLARRNGEVVGRIAAISDPAWNEFHNTDNGFFGLFDCVDDPEVAAGLFDAAAAWVRRRGFKQMMGPVNLSTNHDCGLLIEGFDYPPAMMMPYNFRYYQALFEGNGFKKAKDLYSYELSTSVAPPEKVVRVAEKLKVEGGLTVRPLDMRDLSGETRRIKSIYNAMLERVWGFVPMRDEEFDVVAARLRPLVQVRPELCLIVEAAGEPVAFSLTLPDSNIAIKEAKGRLTTFGVPVGLARLFWATRRIDRLRVLLFGIKPGYRRRGIDALLYMETMRAARELGYSAGELGWTTEDNDLMNRAIESMGARRYKTYRIYERSVLA